MNGNPTDQNFWDAVLGLMEALRDAYRDTAEAPGRIGEAAVPALLDVLRDASERERAAAAWVLWAMRKLIAAAGGASAAPDLVEALHSKDSGVRRAAARGLGWIGESSVISDLLEALHDEDSGVRRDAAGAMGRIGSVNAVPGLLKALHDEHNAVRYAAAWALGRIGDEGAVPELLEVLRDKDRDVRRAAARALGWIGNTDAVPRLLEALNDKSGGVRRDVAGALGRIGDSAAVPVLLKALHDKHEAVRYTAAWGLGRIGNVDAVPALLEALQDEDKDMRRAVAEALGEIGDSRAVPGLLEALRAAQRLGDEAEIYVLGVVLYEMLTASLPAEAREFGAGPSQIIDPVTDASLSVGEMVGSERPHHREGQIISAEEVLRRIDAIVQSGQHLKLSDELAPGAVTQPHADTRPEEVNPEPSFVLLTPSGLSISLKLPETVIGRSNPRDDVFPDIDLRKLEVEYARTVSRRHCRIFWDGIDCFIEDLGSMNGTQVNEVPLNPGQPYRLQHNDQITIGRVVLTFRAGNMI